MSGWLKIYKATTKELIDSDWVVVDRMRLSVAAPLPPTHAELVALEFADRKAFCARLSERRAMARNDFDAPSSQPGFLVAATAAERSDSGREGREQWCLPPRVSSTCSAP